MTRTSKSKLYNMVFVLPLISFILLFVAYPVSSVIYNSFFKSNLNGTQTFVGFKNYAQFFAKRYASQILLNTGMWVGLGVLMKVGLAMIISLALIKNFPLKKTVMQSLIIPWAMPTVIACIIWKMMYQPLFGYINSTFLSLGLIDQPLDWLGNKDTAFIATLLVNVWSTVPLGVLNISSAMATIPIHYYEAALLDGSSAWSNFRHITLPLIAPVLRMLLLLYTIWTFNAFDAIFMMTGGGPSHATETLVVNIYLTGFEANNIGQASAISVVSLIILSVLSLFYLNSARRGEAYD